MNVGQILRVVSLWAPADPKGASGDLDETHEQSRRPKNHSYSLIHGYGPQYMDDRSLRVQWQDGSAAYQGIKW